jgi:hypothetical protein
LRRSRVDKTSKPVNKRIGVKGNGRWEGIEYGESERMVVAMGMEGMME